MKDAPSIQEIIKKSDPGLPETSDHFAAAVILLCMLKVGTRPKTLFHFTGYRLKRVEKFVFRLKENGVIGEDGILCIDWDDEEHGDVAFWLDVMVATGEVQKVYDEVRSN